eukprot:g2122.t1
MASMTKMAAAAKLAEERIRLDIGDDVSVEDEDLGIGHSTRGTQTDPVSFDSRSGGRASGGDPEPSSPQNNREAKTATPRTASARDISKLSRYALQAIVIPDFYTRKVISDASDDLRGGLRLEPREAIEVDS